MTLTRFGFHFASISYDGHSSSSLFGTIRDVARAAESSGFDSIWVPDHVLQGPIGGGREAPMLEAYALLSALGAVTERVKLAALVSPVTFRPPSLLAKQVASLDVISNGRAILGIGAAWDHEEHAAYGIAFPGVGEREDRLTEAVRICRAMLTEETPSFSGTYYDIDAARNVPRPVQARMPILVGGGGERRTLRVVAELADGCNVFGDADALRHKLEVLDEHCAQVGRDRSEIAVTSCVVSPESPAALVDAVGSRFDAGIEGVIVLAANHPDAATVASWGEALTSAFA